jgi:hypothetical protein
LAVKFGSRRRDSSCSFQYTHNTSTPTTPFPIKFMQTAYFMTFGSSIDYEKYSRRLSYTPLFVMG